MGSEIIELGHPKSPSVRVAIFVESHEGYGHFNVVSQLAKELEKIGVEVMILSGTLNYAGAGQTFNFRDSRVVHLPLVDYRIMKGGRWEYITPDSTLYEESPDYIAKRKAMVAEALTSFKPDVVLTELFPFQQSFRKHDIEAVQELKEKDIIHPKIVSLCRDIIHNHKPEQVIGLLNKHYDHILVRGDDRFAKLTDSQQEWGNINVPISYMGNFITPMPERKNEPDDSRHVVVFGGGGYYDNDLPFFESVIRSRAHSKKFGNRIWDIYLSENADKHFIIDPTDSTGTKKISAFDYLERLATTEGQGNIRVFPPIDSKKFRKELSNAAMTVTRGGYNTTFELLSAKQPQLVIPRHSLEQVQRANKLYMNGIAQVYPEYPVPEKNSYSEIRKALRSPESLAKAIDLAPDITASVPELDNHGAENTAKKVMEIVKGKNNSPPLNLLICYQNEKLKKHDAMAIVSHLKSMGHKVTAIDVEKTEIINTESGQCIRHEGCDIPLSSFDGATLRSPTEVKQTELIADAIRQAGVPIYQDYPMLVVAGDKMQSQKLFESNDVPTPKTFGLDYTQIPKPGELEAFVDSLGLGPFVVKSNRGWSGKQVKIVDTKEEALKAFRTFYQQARQDKVGGALMQEFIESNPERRRDYRIQTVVGVDSSGHAQVKIVAAAARVAQPGMRITNTSLGADKIRVSLDEDEAHAFYVVKKKMPEDEFRKKLSNGEIEVLSPALKKAAIKAALAFGSGSLGIDIVVGQNDMQPKLIEVNPFAGGSRNFEETHGFSIFKPWADAFAEFSQHHKQSKSAHDDWVHSVTPNNTARLRG